MTAFITGVLVGWAVLALLVALFLGKAVRIADEAQDGVLDDDVMALVQPENLSAAEVERRFTRMTETWL